MLPRGKPGRNVESRHSVFLFWTICLFAAALSFCPPGHAQVTDLVARSVDINDRRPLAGHRPAWAAIQNDRGAVPANLPLEQLALVLSRSPQQQQAFEQLLKDQQDPSSSNYHHWLTPVELGERFGASQNDIDAISNWLQSQNLTVSSIANNRILIRFSGSASAIARAFGAEMHYFSIDGEQRISITAEPQIPTALMGVINSVSGLSTAVIRPFSEASPVQVPMRSLIHSLAGGSEGGVAPDFTTGSGSHFLFPADFATIYNVNTGSITGAGQTIAIVGLSRVYDQDIINFQTLSGLATKTPTVIIPANGVDPGPPMTSPPSSGSPSSSQVEATLDVTRASSIAPGATIDLVVSGNTASGSGLELAIEDVVNTARAQIMSISFGGCESSNGRNAVNFFDSLFSAAAAEGISVFVASGDSGAAGCDVHFVTPPATQILSPNFLCSSSHVTCVGGTEFADFSTPTLYWASTNNATTRGSAISYIPEGAWNEPLNSSNQPQVAGTGGGVSSFIATPSWQTGTGVPGTQGRYTPDISFSASVHDSYFGCMAAFGTCGPVGGSFAFVSLAGTSASAPDMAGVAALLNQKMGAAQGELNTNLYRLAATPTNNVFHDVTVTSSGVIPCLITTPSMCNNSTPGPSGLAGGLNGYLVGVGYDEATGLGSINVANLLASWSGTAITTTTVGSNLNSLSSGAPITFSATVTTNGPNAPTGAVNFFDGATQIGTGALNGSGNATLTISNLTSPGQHSITAVYNGDSSNSTSTSPNLAVTVNAAIFTLTANAPTSKTISQGQLATYTLTVTPNGSYTSLVSFACSFSPASSATCVFSPPSFTPNSSVASTTVTISGAQAAAPSINVNDQDARRVNPPYGFWLVMEMVGMLLLLAGKKSQLQRLAQLSLTGALLVTTISLAACGSGSTTQTPNPTQTYQVTITASAPASSSGSSASMSQTQTVSLTVQ